MPANQAPAAEGRLEVEVKNFGPIVEARIDLRPLTVLVGPSNTGKSYLAILIYALHRLWSAQTPGPFHFRRGSRTLFPDLFMDASDEAVHGIIEFATQAVNDAVIEFATRAADDAGQSSSKKALVLPASITDAFRISYDKCGEYLDNEIRRCFGVDESATLMRRGAQGRVDVAVCIRNRGNSAAIEQNFRIDAQNSVLKTTIPENTTLPADMMSKDVSPWLFETLAEVRRARGSRGHRDQRFPDFDRFEVLEALAAAIHPLVVGPLAEGAFYLPADRTGVMHVHNVVVSALIGSAAMAAVRPAARTPLLSGVLADFLEELIALGRQPGARRRPRSGLGDGIEAAILKGTIRVETSEAVGYPHFTYSPDGWKDSLTLANASSMVSELAPLVLYLRHKVEPGNTLIIEEPESHLHPAMQVQLTREIAALVRAGIRVVVTTHSEWVLEELANIVGRSRLSEPERHALPGSATALPADDVGVWLFEPKNRPRGSTVREVPLDESGLYSPGFEEVAAALHNDWADISGRIEEDG